MYAFRITTIMLNGYEISGKFQFLKFLIRDFMLKIKSQKLYGSQAFHIMSIILILEK